MTEVFIIFMLSIFLLAIFFRNDYLFTVLYLFAGVYLAGSIWTRKAVESVKFQRIFTNRAFLGEEIPVRLVVTNMSWLPVLWLRIRESLPVDLAVHRFFRQVISLGPKEKRSFDISLTARKRGYYHIGPLSAASGDLFGLSGELQREGGSDYLIVYPKVIPLTRLQLPSRSPLGTLRHKQPVYEDPSRVLNKRDYVPGDSLRRIDWKATAGVGRLQVKQFEPSIALETAIFLNLDAADYEIKTRFDASELAVVVAASIANWIAARKQSVGLYTNGSDPIFEDPEGVNTEGRKVPRARTIPPRKGRPHLMRIFDLLARVQVGRHEPFEDMLRRETVGLSWGTTLVLITPEAGDDLFDALFQVQREGMSAVLVLTGPTPHYREVEEKARTFKIPFYAVASERDLDMWRI